MDGTTDESLAMSGEASGDNLDSNAPNNEGQEVPQKDYEKYAPDTMNEEEIKLLVAENDGDDTKIQKALAERWEESLSEDAEKIPAVEKPKKSKSSRISSKAGSERGSTGSRKSREKASSSTEASSKERTSRSSNESPVKPDKPDKPKKRTHKHKKDKKPPQRMPSLKSSNSQVNLLAQHCFTLSDEAVSALVKYRIPSQSRWDYKQKIHVRDETVKHLQRALDLLNQEKQRFKTACIEIEDALQEEIGDLKNNLAVQMATGGQYSTADGQHITGADDLAELKATLKDKEKELVRLQKENKTLDEEQQKMKQSIMEAKFEKKESNAVQERATEDLTQLRENLKESREALATKNKELSQALESFSKFEQKAEVQAGSGTAQIESLNAKVAELEKEKSDIQNQMSEFKIKIGIDSKELENMNSSFQNVEEERNSLKEVLSDAKSTLALTEQKLATETALKERAEIKENEERNERISASAQLVAIQSHSGTIVTANQEEFDKEKAGLSSNIGKLEAENKRMTEELTELNRKSAGLAAKLEIMTEKVEQSATDMKDAAQLAEKASEVEELKEELKNEKERNQQEIDALLESKNELEQKFKDEEQKVFSMEDERRKLQNLVQELRGNVRVFCRLRPYLPNDKNIDNLEKSNIQVKLDNAAMTITKPDTIGTDNVQTNNFSFDYSFGPHQGQEEIFAEVSEFVQSALDGYNVTLFSYGQTGAGKTHTMQGQGNDNMRGIIPRALEQVGFTQEKLIKQGWEFDLGVTFVEVYNEVVKDLLNEDPEYKADAKSHIIARDAYGMTDVTNVVKVTADPRSKAQIDHIMEVAAKHRSARETDMNAVSSRSHSVFTLHLVARNPAQKAILRGQLNLVDLAGSERVEKSGATSGVALKEAQNINKSLSTLALVFQNLKAKSSHIPFRNSKLTHLLQPSFSGDGKTLMMINLSPTHASYYESLSTLRFGAMVNSCELGRAKRKLNDIDADKKKTKEVKCRRESVVLEDAKKAVPPRTKSHNSLGEKKKGGKKKSKEI